MLKTWHSNSDRWLLGGTGKSRGRLSQTGGPLAHGQGTEWTGREACSQGNSFGVGDAGAGAVTGEHRYEMAPGMAMHGDKMETTQMPQARVWHCVPHGPVKQWSTMESWKKEL